MVGDLYNVIYRDGKMCFQTPAMKVADGTYVSMVTERKLAPLSTEPMFGAQALFHEQQAAQLRRKWGIG